MGAAGRGAERWAAVSRAGPGDQRPRPRGGGRRARRGPGLGAGAPPPTPPRRGEGVGAAARPRVNRLLPPRHGRGWGGGQWGQKRAPRLQRRALVQGEAETNRARAAPAGRRGSGSEPRPPGGAESKSGPFWVGLGPGPW